MMYSAIIIEDEEWVRKGLIKKIQRLAPEIKIVGEAADGCEAIQLLKKIKPDIMITDIKLPIIDGMQLINEVRGEHPLMKIIIVSGFAEFILAQEAIALGVSGYILKPVNEGDLGGVLGRIMREISCMANEYIMPSLPIHVLSAIHEYIAIGHPEELKGSIRVMFAQQNIDETNLVYLDATLKQLMKYVENLLIDNGFLPMEAMSLVHSILKAVPKHNHELGALADYISDELLKYVETAKSASYEMKNIVSAIINMIETNYSQDITLESLSYKYKVDMSHLSRQFKRIGGITFTEYLSDKRLEVAKSLLVNTKLSITEIGDSVGFHDSSYFYKIFKKKTSLTPARYREYHRI